MVLPLGAPPYLLSRSEAKSRIVAAYMLFYSLGVGVGSMISTLVYATAGWNGVCTAGAAMSGMSLLLWAITHRWAPGDARS